MNHPINNNIKRIDFAYAKLTSRNKLNPKFVPKFLKTKSHQF